MKSLSTAAQRAADFGVAVHTCTGCKQTVEVAKRESFDPDTKDYTCRTCHTAKEKARRRAQDVEKHVGNILRPPAEWCLGYPERTHRHAKLTRWSDLTGPAEYMAAVQSVRRFTETGDTVLVVAGTRGSGKTQCIYVACREYIERTADNACMITAIGLIADLKQRYDRKSDDGDEKWLRQWGGCGLLCIDEIGERLDNEHSIAMLTALVDRRYQAMQPTIISGNVAAKDISAACGASIASRCAEGGGVVLFSGWPSWRGA